MQERHARNTLRTAVEDMAAVALLPALVSSAATQVAPDPQSALGLPIAGERGGQLPG
ncbi:hypothetical protein KHP62_00915 [Rhodobacteraceae bacterium NNCM2]|nr:hypothetical protein [Coraliihabitans acroporae]